MSYFTNERGQLSVSAHSAVSPMSIFRRTSAVPCSHMWHSVYSSATLQTTRSGASGTCKYTEKSSWIVLSSARASSPSGHPAYPVRISPWIHYQSLPIHLQAPCLLYPTQSSLFLMNPQSRKHLHLAPTLTPAPNPPWLVVRLDALVPIQPDPAPMNDLPEQLQMPPKVRNLTSHFKQHPSANPLPAKHPS